MIVVTVERWEGPEGIEREAIGRMTLSPCGPEHETGTYGYTIDEGKHPLGVSPLRDRGKILEYPRRQSVWGLVARVIGEAVFKRTTH